MPAAAEMILGNSPSANRRGRSVSNAIDARRPEASMTRPTMSPAGWREARRWVDPTASSPR
jgi:hypothetical protein